MWQYYMHDEEGLCFSCNPYVVFMTLLIDNPSSRLKTSQQPRSHLCLFFQAPGAKIEERPWKRSCSYRWATKYNCSKGAILNFFVEYAFPIIHLACPQSFA